MMITGTLFFIKPDNCPYAIILVKDIRARCVYRVLGASQGFRMKDANTKMSPET
jgi:hypothetical protein